LYKSIYLLTYLHKKVKVIAHSVQVPGDKLSAFVITYPSVQYHKPYFTLHYTRVI